MSKIYGYKEGDIKGLLACIDNNKGMELSRIFAVYAQSIGKSKGTIRNMYYAFAKECAKDDELREYFNVEKPIEVHKIVGFSDEQTEWLITKIIEGKTQNKSVRKILNELSDGDEKVALRLQNKYRNILAKDRQKILDIAREMNAEYLFDKPQLIARERVGAFGIKRLEKEIELLIERIGEKLKKENVVLKEKLSKLQDDNIRLRTRLLTADSQTNGGRQSKSAVDFFGASISDVGQVKE